MLRNAWDLITAFAEFNEPGRDELDRPSSMMSDCNNVSLDEDASYADGF